MATTRKSAGAANSGEDSGTFTVNHKKTVGLPTVFTTNETQPASKAVLYANLGFTTLIAIFAPLQANMAINL